MPEIKISIVGSSASCQEPVYPSSQAFNGVTAPQSWWQSISKGTIAENPGALKNEWVAGHLSSGQAVNKIRYYACALTSKNIKHAKFEGSNDGSNWAKIPAIGWTLGASQYNGNEILFREAEGWQEVTFNNDTAYTRYRLFCYDSYVSGNQVHMAVAELEFYYDDHKPSVTSFAINLGASSTKNKGVTLNNVCTGEPTHYMASEDPDFVLSKIWQGNHDLIGGNKVHDFDAGSSVDWELFKLTVQSSANIEFRSKSAATQAGLDGASYGDWQLGINGSITAGNNRWLRVEIYGGYEPPWITYGSSGSGVGQFNEPKDIHYNSATGFIYVVDCHNHRIVKTKIDGTGWTTYGSQGSGAGQFYIPCGIHYDSASEFIYVADTFNHRVVKTKIDGTGWTTLGGFSYLRGVHYDSASGFIYVGDWSNHRIVKTKIDGSGWTTYGSYGSGVGQFRGPYHIHYDSASGYIYIVDYNNHRIVKTKMDGTGWTTLGGFNNPIGIYYDSASEFIYVGDAYNRRIVKTKIDGSGWTTYGSQGSGVGQFNEPYGVYYDSELIYIADRMNYRIVKCKPDWS